MVNRIELLDYPRKRSWTACRVILLSWMA